MSSAARRTCGTLRSIPGTTPEAVISGHECNERAAMYNCTSGNDDGYVRHIRDSEIARECPYFTGAKFWLLNGGSLGR